MTPRLYADGAELPLFPDGATARITAARLPECCISLYVHEHEDLTSCTAAFTTRGDRVDIELRGAATILGKPVTVAATAEALNRAAPL